MRTLPDVRKRVMAALAAACALPAPALAQGGVNGSIVGSVFDQTGSAIKGVKVSARSDTQIGGAKIAYTNDEGFFRIPGLLPGAFDVTVTAPKLQTVIQKAVKVGLDAPAEVNVVMEVETQVEEVKVVEKGPTVSTISAQVRETFDADFLENLPVENRINVANMAAQNTAGGSMKSGPRFAGGGAEQRAERVEGFQVQGVPVTAGSLAAIEVQTAGYGADNADVPGGVINMVSKSGSNKLEFDINGWFMDSTLSFFKDQSDTDVHSWDYLINPALGGPIVKDRLWFYANGELRSNTTGREKNLSGFDLLPDPPARSNVAVRGNFKLTWQVSPRNKLSSFTSGRSNTNRNQGNGARDEREAYRTTMNRDLFSGLIWESLLGDSLFLRSQAGVQQQWEEAGPERCRTDPIECDNIPQVRNLFPTELRLGNLDVHNQRVYRSLEVINQLEWFAHSKIVGEHSLKAKSRVFAELSEDAQTTPGDHYTVLRGAVPDRQRFYYTNDPRREDARFGWRIRGTSALTTVHALTDSVRLTRHLTFAPGVAYTTTLANNVGQASDLQGGALTPHLAVAWDATHDGRTAVRGSFNQYVDVDSLRLARFALGERVWRECLWSVDTQAFDSQCRYGGGDVGSTIGLPCGPQGVDIHGKACREKLKIPKTWEYTAGIEREIVRGVGLGADLMYRLFTYQYETRETNRIWSDGGLALHPLGGFRNGRNEVVNDLGTPGEARRRYLAVTASLRKREGALKVIGSYTWSRLEGNVYNNEDNELGANPVRDRYYLYGYLPDDFRHNVRLTLTYQATPWLTAGLIYRYKSGLPFQRKFYSEVEGAYRDYRATVGTDPGGNLNDPDDDRALRLPDIQEVNLQVRANLKPLFGTTFEGYVDILNLLALRTTDTVVENDGPAWATPVGRAEPLRLRIGFRYRF